MPSVEWKEADVVAALERPEFFAELAPSLPITEEPLVRDASTGAGPASVASWHARGFTSVPALVEPSNAEAMAKAISTIADLGLPPVFAYVYDAFWRPAEALSRTLEPVLGQHELLADAWAWLIPTGEEHAGWPPHRGSYDLDPGARPAMINVWIALTKVDHSNACMHVVPLDRDPAYPHRLQDVSGVGEGIAMPAEPGAALLWDANVLHWGGRSTRHAIGPRISFSYTFRARAASGTCRAYAAMQPGPLPFRARLDLIAAQIDRYGDREAIAPAVRAWARALVLLSRLSRPKA